MKYLGKMILGTNGAGKGPWVSAHWIQKKLREGIQRIFGEYKKGQCRCTKCGCVTDSYRILYEGNKSVLLCNNCCIGKKPSRKFVT